MDCCRCVRRSPCLLGLLWAVILMYHSVRPAASVQVRINCTHMHTYMYVHIHVLARILPALKKSGSTSCVCRYLYIHIDACNNYRYPSSKCTCDSYYALLLYLFSADGDDFILLAPTTVSFLESENPQTGDGRCVNVMITDDENYEGDHTFTMSLGPLTVSPSLATIIGGSATVTIQDNDGNCPNATCLYFGALWVCVESWLAVEVRLFNPPPQLSQGWAFKCLLGLFFSIISFLASYILYTHAIV